MNNFTIKRSVNVYHAFSNLISVGYFEIYVALVLNSYSSRGCEIGPICYKKCLHLTNRRTCQRYTSEDKVHCERVTHLLKNFSVALTKNSRDAYYARLKKLYKTLT